MVRKESSSADCQTKRRFGPQSMVEGNEMELLDCKMLDTSAGGELGWVLVEDSNIRARGGLYPGQNKLARRHL